ncbi:MAG: hypothetical protein H6684_02450 [Deltaproteobacteria bacterium]|nr:hypothetical protein [Deltaproteobacteria bacterium]
MKIGEKTRLFTALACLLLIAASTASTRLFEDRYARRDFSDREEWAFWKAVNGAGPWRDLDGDGVHLPFDDITPAWLEAGEQIAKIRAWTGDPSEADLLRWVGGALAWLAILGVAVAATGFWRDFRAGALSALFLLTLLPTHELFWRATPETTTAAFIALALALVAIVPLRWRPLAAIPLAYAAAQFEFVGPLVYLLAPTLIVTAVLSVNLSVEEDASPRRRAAIRASGIAALILALVAVVFILKNSSAVRNFSTTPQVFDPRIVRATPGTPVPLLIGRAITENYIVMIFAAVGLVGALRKRHRKALLPVVGALGAVVVAGILRPDLTATFRVALGVVSVVPAGGIFRVVDGNTRPEDWPSGLSKVGAVVLAVALAFSVFPAKRIVKMDKPTYEPAMSDVRFAQEKIPADWTILEGARSLSLLRKTCALPYRLRPRASDGTVLRDSIIMRDTLRLLESNHLYQCDLIVLDEVFEKALPESVLLRIKADYVHQGYGYYVWPPGKEKPKPEPLGRPCTSLTAAEATATPAAAGSRKQNTRT